LGIGLALVKSLVELHDGTVKAYSAGPGQGSRFTVCLPHLPQRERDTPALQASAPGDAQSVLKVMVVDDNVDAADMLADFIATLGHRVAIEYGSRPALERIAGFAADVFLLDLGLPDVDGYALARRLRATPAIAGATLIAVTGYGDEQARQLATNAGFDDHFVKPVDTTRLVALLGEIGKASASRANRPP
jgi:CheY-like chemotaxis protein